MSNEQLSFENNKTSSSKKTVSKGTMLEYQMQRLFFAMGYYSKTDIIVRSSKEAIADVITDLDAYGVYIHKNFTSKKIWADCKSGKAKPLERISWIKGIRSTIQVDDIIFVKNGVRVSTKQFAHQSDIMVLDETLILKLEADYDINTNDWSGPWNPKLQQNMIPRLRELDKISRGICFRSADFISSSYWYLGNYSRVKKCITAIRDLKTYEQTCLNDEQHKIVKWAILQLIPMFTLATLNICRELYFLNDHDKEVIIRDKLISSEISVTKRSAIVNATFKLAQGIIAQNYPTVTIPDFDPNLGLNPPNYYEKFCNLIIRITDHPNNYYDVLRLLDYTLQEYELQNIMIDETNVQDKISNYTNAQIGFKTILHFIIDVCDIPVDYFSHVLN